MAEPKKAPKKAARPGHAGLTKEQRRKIEAMGRGALEGVAEVAQSALSGPAAIVGGGAKALAEKSAKRKIPGKKGGGKVRGYSSGGKVHRAGLARRRRS